MRIKNLVLWISLVTIMALMLPLFSSCTRLAASAATPTRSPSVDLSQYLNSDPAKVDNSQLPITPTDELFVTGTPPKIDMAKYRLTVDGQVETPLSLTYDAVMQYPSVTQVVLLICSWVGAGNVEWTGVPVSTLLQEASIKPNATEVNFYAADGYKDTLTLEEAQRDGVFLAYKINGQTLPEKQGYPLRLVVKGMVGSYWVQWVTRIEVV